MQWFEALRNRSCYVARRGGGRKDTSQFSEEIAHRFRVSSFQVKPRHSANGILFQVRIRSRTMECRFSLVPTDIITVGRRL